MCCHLKNKYATRMIGGFDEMNNPKIVAIDESLLLRNSNNEQIWIIGGIETKFPRVRLEITKSRSSTEIFNFINNNFLEGTRFTHDNWS